MVISASTASAFADEGMWLFNESPAQTIQGEISVRANAAVARASPEIERPFQFRRERLFRFLERTRHHEPSRRARYAPEDQQRKKQLRARWVLRQSAEGRGQGDRSRAQRADVDRGCDRQGESGDSARHVRRRCRQSARQRHCPDREGVARENRIALGCGHSLSGRAVPPLSLQTLR